MQSTESGKSHPFEEDLELIEPDFKPSMIDRSMTIEVLRDLPESVKAVCKERAKAGWKFYFVKQRRGRCYHGPMVITLPTWAMKKSLSYKTWYICHEMAHTFTPGDHHGQKFMAKLIEICPKDSIVHELSYKPRNASKAGIGQIDLTDL
jgi:predicted metal-dependent hydrolase